MEKPESKAQIRTQIARQIDDYLNKGGAVEAVPRGISGRDDTAALPLSRVFFEGPKAQRTLVPEIVAALESRRLKPTITKSKPRQPRKKIIYDDFGEPLRWVWVDE